MNYWERWPKHPIEKFYVREDTYRKRGAAYRAFYKWVCKEGLFGNIKRFVDSSGRPYYRREPARLSYSQTGYLSGLPSFYATRSVAIDYWNKGFHEAKSRVLDAHRKACFAKIEAERKRERVTSAHNSRTVHFFRTLHQASKLKCPIKPLPKKTRASRNSAS